MGLEDAAAIHVCFSFQYNGEFWEGVVVSLTFGGRDTEPKEVFKDVIVTPYVTHFLISLLKNISIRGNNLILSFSFTFN